MYFWKCSIVEMTEVRLDRQLRLAYFLFWLKLSELIETVIFIMRKKQSQVTKLHVFHHITTVTLIYMLIHYNNNGEYFSQYLLKWKTLFICLFVFFLFVSLGTDALYPVFLNSIVHIIMYSYYLVAAVADKNIVRKLTPIKKSITIIQMVQFLMILIHAAMVLTICGCPKVTFIYFIVVIIVMFYGFYDFYTDSYNRQQLKKTENEAIPIVSLYDGIIATTKTK